MEWQVPLSEGTARCDTESTEVSFHSCQMGKSVLCFLLRAGSHTQLPFFLGGGPARGTCVQSQKDRTEGANISCWEGGREQRLSGEPAEGEEDPPSSPPE